MSDAIVSQCTKSCSMCKITKPLTEFSKRKDRPGGHAYHCRQCHIARYSERGKLSAARYAEANPSKIKASQSRYYSENKALIAEKSASYRACNRTKISAQELVNKHLRHGKLFRQPCEVCGAEHVDAHHDRYDKPLDVRWLCRTHHKQWHSENGPGLNG